MLISRMSFREPHPWFSDHISELFVVPPRVQVCQPTRAADSLKAAVEAPMPVPTHEYPEIPATHAMAGAGFEALRYP